MTTLYCVPGLGTDERIFSNLFPLLESYEKVVLSHITPLHDKESLADYASRLAQTIPVDQQEPIILLGFSLGGPIALEIAKHYPNASVLLISTMKQKKEIPPLFKMARWLPLHRLVPLWYTHHIIPRLAPLTGIAERESSPVLGAMFKAQPAIHFAWGRQAIVNWENEKLPTQVWHINGDKDHIFNTSLPYVDHCIKGGTHNMIMDRAEEVAAWLLPILNKISA